MASIATDRPKRPNAGNRMADLISGKEEKDEFYDTAYGGFKEAEGDNEYKEEKEAEDDTVDSDFDEDEQTPKVSENGSNKRPSEVEGVAEEPVAKKLKEDDGAVAEDTNGKADESAKAESVDAGLAEESIDEEDEGEEEEVDDEEDVGDEDFSGAEEEESNEGFAIEDDDEEQSNEGFAQGEEESNEAASKDEDESNE